MAEKIVVINGGAGVRRFEVRVKTDEGTVTHKIRLAPGTNLLDKELADKMIENYPDECEAWNISIMGTVQAAGEPTLKDFDITELNANDAKHTVKTCVDMEALKVWLDQENNRKAKRLHDKDGPRKTVKDLLLKQIEIVGISLESETDK